MGLPDHISVVSGRKNTKKRIDRIFPEFDLKKVQSFYWTAPFLCLYLFAKIKKVDCKNEEVVNEMDTEGKPETVGLDLAYLP